MSPCVPPLAAATASLTKPGSVWTRVGNTAAAMTSTANRARYPAAKPRKPIRPRMPALRYWRRYMPVMPARASAIMTILAVSRTTHWWVSVVKVSAAGWPIWTAMKMDPATAAATPADLVRPVAVMGMAGS